MEALAIVLAVASSSLLGFGFAAMAFGEDPVRRRDDDPYKVIVLVGLDKIHQEISQEDDAAIVSKSEVA